MNNMEDISLTDRKEEEIQNEQFLQNNETYQSVKSSESIKTEDEFDAIRSTN